MERVAIPFAHGGTRVNTQVTVPRSNCVSHQPTRPERHLLPRFRQRLSTLGHLVGGPADLGVGVGQRHTPVAAEGLLGDPQRKRGLPTLELVAINQAGHPPGQLGIGTGGEQLLHGEVVVDVPLQHGVELVVGGQALVVAGRAEARPTAPC